MRLKITFTILLLISITGISAQEKFIASFEAEPGQYERINTPVSAVLDNYSPNEDTCTLVMYEMTGGVKREVPVQVETGIETRLWWILDGVTEAGRARQYDLFCTCKRENEYQLKAIINDDNLRITHGGHDVLQYNHAVHYPPEGVDTIFKRSAFIHPLWSPSGNILTRINPPDHYHHYGIWNPWTKVYYRNREIDFWNLGKRQGTVKFIGYISNASGNVYSGFISLHNHIINDKPGIDLNVMNEIWDVKSWVINIPGSGQVYMVDLVSLLSCATPDSVILDSYTYGGGIGFRATEEWTNKNSRVITSEDHTRKDADATKARWANVGGSFADNTYSGIVFFSHPSNRDHPEPMRVWPSDSNGGRGDVFFEFCPIRHNRWILEPGKTYRQKYRMLIYDGKLDSLIIEKIWNDFVFPPEVKILHKKVSYE